MSLGRRDTSCIRRQVVAGRRRCRARERGQALVLAVVCLLVIALAFFAAFDTGQTVTKKEQLINAADAAAYSVGIEQARALNTVAYLNRAEVANQIFIAQLVSLQSYANYGDSLAGRGANVLTYAGVALEAAFGAGTVLIEAANLIREVQQGYAEGLVLERKALDVIVNAVNALNLVYSKGQDAVLKGFSIESGFSTAESVVQANTLDADGESHATIPAVGHALLTFQLGCFVDVACAGPEAITSNKGYAVRYKIPHQAHAGDHLDRTWAADRYANLVMRARDDFSTTRTRHKSISPIPGLFKMTTEKFGGTDLVDYNRWVAVDDIGLNIKVGTCGFFAILCIKKNGLTFGMGAAAAMPSEMIVDSSSAIMSPGTRLTQGSGNGGSYVPGTGAGWYSPYAATLSKPYQGALTNLAWGANVANHPTDQGNDDFLSWPYPPVPSVATPAKVAWLPSTGSGLQNYNDVAPDKAVQPYATSSTTDDDVGPIFTVFVQQPDATVRTGANIGMEGGDLQLVNQGVGNAMSAMSSAQVYYDRPAWNLPFLARRADDANDRKHELGNLFEPYWQVRLVPTPTVIKVTLVGSEMAGL